MITPADLLCNHAYRDLRVALRVVWLAGFVARWRLPFSHVASKFGVALILHKIEVVGRAERILRTLRRVCEMSVSTRGAQLSWRFDQHRDTYAW